jgi:hypothetical protein
MLFDYYDPFLTYYLLPNFILQDNFLDIEEQCLYSESPRVQKHVVNVAGGL